MKQYGKTMLCLLVLLACMLPLRAQFVLSQKVVDDTAEKIIANLKKVQARDGSFSYDSHYRVGTTALVVYAMASAGRTESDPAVNAGVSYLLKNHSLSTYEEGLVICALQRLNGKKYQDRIQQAHEYLLQTQVPVGGWGYGDNIRVQPEYADESCSQYAILGLASAKEIGLEIPQKTLNAALGFYGRRQNSDGGWPYVRGNSTFSMTSASLSSLRLLGLTLEKVACADGGANHYVGHYFFRWGTSTNAIPPYASYKHGGRINLSFADGHAASYTRQEFNPADTYASSLKISFKLFCNL